MKQHAGFEPWIPVRFNFEISVQIKTSSTTSTVVVPSMLLRASG
jgi:hypothetical protein